MSLVFFVLLVARSKTLAAEWGAEIKLSSGEANATTNENSSQGLAVSGNTVHLVWCERQNNDSAIFYKHSNDGGVTWGANTRLTDDPGSADFASLAVSGSTVHVAFRDKRAGESGSYYKRSLDGGNTWGPDVFQGKTTFWPSIAATGSTVYMALNNDIGNNTEVFCVRSTDNGTSWDPVQRISNAPGRSEDPAIAASGNNVQLVWNDNRTGIMQMFYRRSADRGVTWGPETQLSQAAAFAYMPMLYLNNSDVDVVRGNRRTIGEKSTFDIHHLHSVDLGSTWGPEERLTDTAVGSAYPVIARDGKNVHVVWFGGGLFYLHSGDGGATWDPVLNVVGGSSKPSGAFIALSGSVLHLIWTDRRNGNSTIYYKSNPTGNSDQSKNSSR
jgi:hypothetical protein